MANKDSNSGTVTIKDIAAMCNVSISTVSNVLNGKTKKVGPDVCKKVFEAVERTGYRPNYLAKGLRAASTKTIGIIAEDLILFSVPSIIEGIMNACEEQGYNIVIENMRLFGRWGNSWLHNGSLFLSALQPALNKLEAINVDGIIYIGSFEHSISGLKTVNNIPIVTAYSYVEDDTKPAFCLDDEWGGYEVTNYLLSKGHKKIGLITGEADNAHTIGRLRGVQKAYFDSNILFNPELVSYQTWSRDGGYDGMKKLIDKEVSAVFCFSDAIAAGVYACLYENGLTPGKDVAVMGYDNQDVATFLFPQLTTMALPLEELGYEAVTRLIHIIEKTEDTEEIENDIRIKPTLIERDSVNRK